MIQQIANEVNHRNYAVADWLSTRLLMHFKYPTKPYNISMDLKASLKVAKHDKGQKLQRSLNAIDNDLTLLAKQNCQK